MNIQEIRQKYPQYGDLSDEQLATALHSKFYADMPYGDFAQKVGVSSKPAPKESGERGMVESVGRQLGLTARSAIGGIGGLANMVADPVVAGINAMGGSLPMPSQALERTMTRLGLPEPASGTERFANSVNRGMMGPASVAKALPQYGKQIGTQILSGGMGAGSGEIAQEMGAGPIGTFAASVGGGMVAPAAVVAGDEMRKAAMRGAGALAEPFTERGRDRIVARTMQNAASDKDLAAQNARSAPQYVPGVQPTLAQASDDAGLAGLEKAVKTRNKDTFADLEIKQDAARQQALKQSLGSQTDLAMAEQARDDVTKPLRDAAFSEAKKVDVRPILNTAKTVTKSGPGARQEVERAMGWVQDRLRGENDPERIYAIRQDINDIIAGKMKDPEKASYQLAAGQLKAVKAVLDQQLEKAAPGFRNYLREYADRSRPIDSMRTGQEIAGAAKNPLTERLSPAGFARQMENRSEDVANMGAIGSDVMSRMNADLKRSVAPDVKMRAPGSDTAQNMVAQSVLGQALGPSGNATMPRVLQKLGGLLYSPVEQQTQDQLLAAMLDKDKGAGLLAMQISQNPKLAEELRKRLLMIPQGGLLGIGAAH